MEENTRKIIEKAEQEVQEQFKIAEDICNFNSEKVLKAFQKNNTTEADFGMTT